VFRPNKRSDDKYDPPLGMEKDRSGQKEGCRLQKWRDGGEILSWRKGHPPKTPPPTTKKKKKKQKKKKKKNNTTEKKKKKNKGGYPDRERGENPKLGGGCEHPTEEDD